MEDTRPSSHIAPHIKSEHGPFRPHESQTVPGNPDIFCGSGACRTSLFFYKPCMTIRCCQTRTMVLTRRVRRGGVVGARPALEVQNGLRLDRTDRTKATNPAWH